MKQTAMQQLLAQLKYERANIPMDIEWDRCYQAIETVIQDIYLPIEKEQVMDAYSTGADDEYEHHVNLSVKREDIDCEKYYNETYGK